MKKGLLLLGLMLSAIFSISQPSYKSAIICFYNFENFYDTLFHGSNDDIAFTPTGAKAYTSSVFNHKVGRLARVISQIGTAINTDGPALLGTAEIENKFVLDTLLRHPLLAQRNYQYVHYDSRDFRGVDVALIYNPQYFKVLKSRPIFVKLPSGTKDAVFTRDILWVQGELDGEKMNVFVNHWPSRAGGEKRSEPARMAAAVTVKNFIDSLEIVSPGVKTIIMGDLNDDPVNNSIKEGLKAVGDKKNILPDQFYNPWLKMYKAGAGTLAYQDAWSLFDQVILSSSFLNKGQDGFYFYKAQVFKATFMIENSGRYKGYPMRSYIGNTYRGGYSDHFPAYIVLRKKLQNN